MVRLYRVSVSVSVKSTFLRFFALVLPLVSAVVVTTLSLQTVNAQVTPAQKQAVKNLVSTALLIIILLRLLNPEKFIANTRKYSERNIETCKGSATKYFSYQPILDNHKYQSIRLMAHHAA